MADSHPFKDNHQKKLHVSKYIIFLAVFAGQGFSIRIQQFGSLELDLPTPVSHPPTRGMNPCSGMAYPPLQKYICKYIKNKINESCINDIKFTNKLISN